MLCYAFDWITPPQQPEYCILPEQGEFTAGGTKYFIFQGLNRIGYSEPSAPVEVVFDVGDAIEIIPPADILPIGGFFFWVVSVSDTIDGTYTQVAKWRLFDDDQETELTLSSLILSRDEDWLTGEEIVLAGLPLEPKNGITKLISDVVPEAYYEYLDWAPSVDSNTSIAADVGAWVRMPGVPTPGLIDDAFGVGGCGIAANSLTELVLEPPAYSYSTDTRSPKVKFMWLSRERNVEPGVGFTFKFFADGVDISQDLDNLVFLNIAGLYNYSSTTLSASGVSNVGQTISWQYGYKGLISLLSQLNVGQGLLFDLWYKLDGAEDRFSSLPLSFDISIQSFYYSQIGEYAGILQTLVVPKNTNGCVFYGEGMLRMVPDQVLPGSAIVGNFVFPSLGQSIPILGYQANTANQRLTVNGNRSFFVRQSTDTIPSTEAIRAIFSTTAGLCKVSDWSPEIDIDLGGGISVTFSYPIADGQGVISSTYPTIAGMQGDFNPPFLRWWLTDGVNLWKSPSDLAVLPVNGTQVLQITALTGLTSVASVDSAVITNPLFNSPTITTEEITGTIPAGSYQIKVAYYYAGTQISAISHDESLGCIPELSLSLVEACFRAQYWLAPQQWAGFRLKSPTDIIPYAEFKLIDENGAWYSAVWDGYSLAEPDGVTVRVLDGQLSTTPGRVILLVSDLTLGKYFLPPTSIELLPNLPSKDGSVVDGSFRLVFSRGKWRQYRFELLSSVAHNGASVIKPSDRTDESGRWVLFKPGISFGQALAAAAAMS